MLLNKELELYKPELTRKPAILALNKMDMEGAEECLLETKQLLQERDYASISEELRTASMIQFEDIIPVSAQEGHGIDLLKDRIRTTIDEIHQREHQEDMKEQANCRWPLNPEIIVPDFKQDIIVP